MFANRWNLDVLEDAFERWRHDPQAVDASWRHFFEGFELGASKTEPGEERGAQAGVTKLVEAYRELGHFLAHINPLSDPEPDHAQLELAAFGLSEADLDRVFDTSIVAGLPQATLRELLAALRETYCRTIGVEFMHIQDLEVRRWFCERMEPRHNRPDLGRRQKLRILTNLHCTELFEKFLHARYVGQKRFSLEGSETLIPMLDAIVQRAGDHGVREIVLGMAHRGRLNVLVNILGKPFQEIFAEFEDVHGDTVDGDGDVKYHLGFSCDARTPGGTSLHISLTPNPSHLEAVYPVVVGRTRAKQFLHEDQERRLGIPVVIHGDAALIGQGAVAETLNLAHLTGYKVGGTIHVVINNQIGFTTAPADARSTRYCTDVAKMLEAPIFHINYEDPEAAVYLAELAFDFRQHFRSDVFLDLVCYRRHGHNEGDEPAFTQPVMYRQIAERPSVTELYTRQLVDAGVLQAEDAESLAETFRAKLSEAQEEMKSATKHTRGMRGYARRWQGISPRYSHAAVATGVKLETLRQISEGLARLPDGFAAHPKIVRALQDRHATLTPPSPPLGKGGTADSPPLARGTADSPPLARGTADFPPLGKGGPGGVDWSFAEALAFGSLVLEGIPVRFSGQDSRRGTFSQRHAVLVDSQTGKEYVPLDHLRADQPRFCIYDSPLAETAVLGFEFGFALEDPNVLVLWEAQFGDFANGAQVIIDQFLTCSQSKWQRDNGLVLLLPHGYEGQGPEHSSARLERYLQACAEDNIQVCQPTTPAQYFHVLRRQIKRNFRKPLILMTPKSLLRHKEVVSPVDELVSGSFQEVIDDEVNAAKVRRMLFCTGKVYYDLRAHKERDDVALVRIEQLYPFPEDQVKKMLRRFAHARSWFWVQEESQNMGAWSFMESRLRALGCEVEYIGRDASASPATGSHHVHRLEQQELISAAFKEKHSFVVRASRDGEAARSKQPARAKA